MAKRFTDSEKWKDDWYISLSNDYKIVWQWLLDNCTHTGLCKRSIGLLNLMCRVNCTEDELIKVMDGRVIIYNDYWFIPKFIKFQYSTLNSGKPAIISVVKDLFKHNLIEMIPESYGNDYKIISKSFDNHCIMIKDKDKDKVKDHINGEKNKKIYAVSVDLESDVAIFPDGTYQKLTNYQRVRIVNNDLKPSEILKAQTN